MEKLLETEIVREKGFLYFCKTENGKITIYRAKMGRGKRDSSSPLL